MRAPMVPAPRTATLWMRFMRLKLRGEARRSARASQNPNHKEQYGIHEGHHSKGFRPALAVTTACAGLVDLIRAFKDNRITTEVHRGSQGNSNWEFEAEKFYISS